MPSDSTPYPVRLPDVMRKRIKDTSEKVGLKFPDTLRKSIDLGLPLLEKRMATKTEMKL